MSVDWRREAFLDEVADQAPAVAPALEEALAELLDADLPTLDARLAELLATGTVATGDGSVVAMTARGRTGRRLVIAGGAMVSVLAATSGLAAASVLPSPVQRAVAEAASHVGIAFPTPEGNEHVAPSTTMVLPAVELPPSAVVPPSPAAAAPATTARSTSTRSAAAPAPTSPSPGPPATGGVGRPPTFGAAVEAFRACLRADADGVQCTPPDPAAYGLPVGAGPADVAAFRTAVAAYVSCLRSAGSREAAAACVRPRAGDYGLGRDLGGSTAPPTSAVSPPTSNDPTQERPRSGDGRRPPTTPPATSVPPDRSSPEVSSPDGGSRDGRRSWWDPRSHWGDASEQSDAPSRRG